MGGQGSWAFVGQGWLQVRRVNVTVREASAVVMLAVSLNYVKTDVSNAWCINCMTA